MVFEVSQSNFRFNALDTTVVLHSVRVHVGFGFGGIKTKSRPLRAMAHLKKSIIEDKAEANCLAHALIIAIAKVTNYEAYI
jgi:hypothetical protein